MPDPATYHGARLQARKRLTVSHSGLRLYRIKTGIGQDLDHIPSPLKTLLPKLSEAEISDLPYPPDAYPNPRDVESPYGSLRVYEWGPEEGRKVLLIHGISNPCIAMGGIAHGLVDRGCRVILFDLPGKGYSSTPSAPHSVRLFTTCILLALTSSPIPWTGNGSSFSLIGYSLGGGIAVNFCSYFPSLMSSLILLAPAGLVRKERVTLLNKLIYNTGLIPEFMLERIIQKRLERGDPPIKAKDIPPAAQIAEELPQEKPGAAAKVPILSKARPNATIPNIIVSMSSHIHVLPAKQCLFVGMADWGSSRFRQIFHIKLTLRTHCWSTRRLAENRRQTICSACVS